MSKPLRRARGTAIALFTAWFGYASSGLPAVSLAAPASDEERAARFATTLARSLTAVEDGDRALDRDRFDPQFVVNTVGVEPEALFEWVRRETRWVPYRGLLRGAAGVLSDRVGSSLDRAVLLATLLTRAGEEVRLARAELPMERARAVVEGLVLEGRGASAVAAVTPPASGSVDARAVALQYSLDPAAIGTVLDAAARDSENTTIATSTSVEDQAARLSAVLGAAPPDDSNLVGAAESLADHWWVQLRSGGKWSDLDLLAPDGKTGSALAPAIASVALDAIPAGLVHTVTLRIVAEQWRDGHVTEHVVSERSLAAHEALGQRILLRHLPTIWPQDWPAVTPDDVQVRLKAAVLTQREWIPVLMIGDTPFASQSIRDSGVVNDKPTPRNPFAALGIPAAGIAGKAADAFAAPPPGEPAAAPKPASPDARAPNPEGELTAEWIDVVIRAPGIPDRTVRRELFDVLGPARRGAGGAIPFEMSEAKALARSTAQLAETELLVTPCALAREYVAHLGAEALLANKELLSDLARDPFAKNAPNYTETFTKMKPLPGPLLGFARLRFEASPVADRVFVDRPNVFAQHAELVADARGDFHPRVSIDVIANDVGVDPGERDARGVRLSQGVADTNAESAALVGDGAARGPAQAFGAAATSGSAGWIALRPGDERKLASLGFSADLATRLGAELAVGQVVVVPAPLAPTTDVAGWWRIDPHTGTTVGIGPNGWGQAMVEYMFVFLFEFTINQAICMLETAPMGNTKAAHAAARACLIGSLWGAGRSLITMGLISRGRGASGAAAGRGAAAAEEGAAGAGRGGARPGAGGGTPFGEGGGSRTQPLPRGGASPTSPMASTRPGAGAGASPKSPAASTMPEAPAGARAGRPGGVDPLGDTHPGAPSAGRPGGGAGAGDPAAAVDNARRAAQEAAAREQAAIDRFKREGTEDARRDAMKAWKDAGDARWDYTDAWRKAGQPGFPPELPGSPRTGGSMPPSPSAPGIDPYGRTSPGVDPLGRTSPIGGASDATAPGVDPLGKTAPGVDPYGKTSPGADPMGSTSPGVPPTQRSPWPSPGKGGAAPAPSSGVGGTPPIGNAAPGGKLGDTRPAPYAPGVPASPAATQAGLGALLTGFAGFGSSMSNLGPP